MTRRSDRVKGKASKDLKEYELITIRGVECVVWKFLDKDQHSSKVAINRKRAALKDEVGSIELDTPMLDTKTGRKGKQELCDAILISHNIEQWERYYVDLYKVKHGITPTKKQQSDTYHQLIWSKRGKTFLMMSIWSNKNKLMVQPGQQNESVLLDWLEESKNIKLLLQSSDKLLTSLDNGSQAEAADPASPSIADTAIPVTINAALKPPWIQPTTSSSPTPTGGQQSDAGSSNMPSDKNNMLSPATTKSLTTSTSKEPRLTQPSHVALPPAGSSNMPSDKGNMLSPATTKSLTTSTSKESRLTQPSHVALPSKLVEEQSDTGTSNMLNDKTSTLSPATTKSPTTAVTEEPHLTQPSHVALPPKSTSQESETDVTSHLLEEIERLNSVIDTKKCEIKLTLEKMKNADCEVSLLDKANKELKKQIEKQKKELRKAQNIKDSVAKEKIILKKDLSRAEQLIDSLRQTIAKGNQGNNTTWAKVVSSTPSDGKTTCTSKWGMKSKPGQPLKPPCKVQGSTKSKQKCQAPSTPQMLPNMVPNENKIEMLQNNTETLQNMKPNVNNTKNGPVLQMTGDYVISDISGQLRFESMAYINPTADASYIESRLHEQIGKGDHKFTLIQCGSNNLGEELRKSIPALGSMIDKALQVNQGQILINAIPGHLFDEKHNETVVRLNTFLKHKCNRTNRLHYVNCNPRLDAVHYMKNGLHFNERGKQMYASYLTTSLSLIRNFVCPINSTAL